MSSGFSSAWDSPGFLLWHATLRWQRTMRATLAPHGLTHVQFVLLASTWWLCDHGGPPTQRALADQAGTDPMMTSQVVRSLQTAGWVTRERDPGDGRVMRVGVTPAGRTLAQRAVVDVERADRAFFAAADADLVPHLRALAGVEVPPPPV